MFNRFKVLLSLSILAVLGILLGQNRTLLALKFLCADLAKSCFYQTPALPLALWMGLFILAGIITSLIWQVLNRAAYPSIKPAKTYEDPELYRAPNNNSRDNRTSSWQANSEREPWDIQTPPTPTSQNGISSSTPVDTAVYERQREPQQVQHSGSTYSYKFKEANSDPVDSTSPDDAARETKSKDDDEEEWI
jgi:hypothetical protein